MRQKMRTFKGGYKFRKLTGYPKPVLHEAGVPNTVIIPLRQGFGEEVPAIIKVGDKAKAGQIIGINDNSCSSPIHATINGIVREVRSISLLDKDARAVVIESDGSDGWIMMENRSADLNDKSHNEIANLLYLSGASSLGSHGFPTEYNTSPIQPDRVESLIINAVKSEPYSLSNWMLLSDKLDKFVTGLDILRRALSDKVEVYVSIDDRDREIISGIESASDFGWLHIHPLKAKYPQDHDVILAQTILGREVPYGDSILDMQTVVLDVQAVLHAYDAVIEGKPIMERVLALGGTGLRESLFVKVRVGTPIEHILSPFMIDAESRYILGGVMTGKICPDLSMPIDRSADSITVLRENRERQFMFFMRPGVDRDSFSNAFMSSLIPTVSRRADTNLNGEFRPCIYCNYCESVCPVGLMPYILNNYATHEMLEEASNQRILRCIDCGLCDYVCPSKIPLMENIQEAKRIVRENNL